MSAIWQDMRYAGRMLRRQPAFTIVAVLTLALGIGANTAVFTVVNGVLLRPLAYGDANRLVVLLYGRPGRVSPWFSPPNYVDFTNQSGAFTESAAFSPTTVNITGHGDPARVDGAAVSWNFFSVLKTPLPLGRAFLADDAKGADASVVIISDGFWKRQFGSRLDVVGSTMHMDGKPMTIVGVAGPEVKLPRKADFWQPLIFSPKDVAPQARGAQWVSVVARLKPNADLPQVNAALKTVSTRLAVDYPKTNEGHLALAVPLQQQMVSAVRPALLILLAAVSFVLLIACVNVANLLLARAQGRSREVAVRAALGAGRRRLVQQFLSESLVLGGLGAAGGLAVAYWCTRALVWLGPASIPRLAEVSIDLRVLAFTVAIAFGTSIVFGLAPALASTGGAVARFIGSAGRGAVGGSGTRVRKLLVVCELALAVILLVGAGLLIRSYQQLQHVNPGFDPEHVLTFNVSMPEAKYPESKDAGAFVAALVSRLQTRPGIERAAAVFGLPFAGDFSASTSFTRPGEVDSADTPSAGMRIVTPGYFATMKIPLKRGRLFDAHDDETGSEVVLINERAAQRFWAGQNPIGQQIHIGVRLARGARSGQKTIVGVVGDVKYGALDTETPVEVYLPVRAAPGRCRDDRAAHSGRPIVAGAHAAERGRVTRSGNAGRRRAVDDGAHRIIGRRAPLHDAAARELRDRRRGAGGDWHLRRAGLRREPAHSGDRRPSRDRRVAGQRRRVVRARGCGAGAGRSDERRRRRAWCVARAGNAVVRRHAGRPADVRRRRSGPGDRRAAGDVRARPPRGGGRSDECIEK